MNLFKTRADWPILPVQTLTVNVEKQVPPRVAAIPHAMVLPKPQNNIYAEEKCPCGPHCLICRKEEEENTEDWNSDRPENQQRSHNHYPQNPQHPQTYDVPDQYSEQIRLRREWYEKMEYLNEKYNLDYYSSLESDSNFEPEHKYETCI